MPPVFISWKSPAEERAVGDSAFCFLSRDREERFNPFYWFVRGSWYRFRRAGSFIGTYSLNRRQSEIGKGPS